MRYLILMLALLAISGCGETTATNNEEERSETATPMIDGDQLFSVLSDLFKTQAATTLVIGTEGETTTFDGEIRLNVPNPNFNLTALAQMVHGKAMVAGTTEWDYKIARSNNWGQTWRTTLGLIVPAAISINANNNMADIAEAGFNLGVSGFNAFRDLGVAQSEQPPIMLPVPGVVNNYNGDQLTAGEGINTGSIAKTEVLPATDLPTSETHITLGENAVFVAEGGTAELTALGDITDAGVALGGSTVTLDKSIKNENQNNPMTCIPDPTTGAGCI